MVERFRKARVLMSSDPNGQWVSYLDYIALQAELDKARSEFICEPAECSPNCDIPDCPYMHSPLTWRQQAENLSTALTEAKQGIERTLTVCADIARKAHASPPRERMTASEAYSYAVAHGAEIADQIEALKVKEKHNAPME